jgi:hypothetical protein
MCFVISDLIGRSSGVRERHGHKELDECLRTETSRRSLVSLYFSVDRGLSRGKWECKNVEARPDKQRCFLALG